jgi:flagellar biosynthesis/type III secretory pathway chaperone
LSEYFKYLTELLDKELATFRLMLAALDSEQRALIDNDIQGLDEAVATQKALVQRASTQELARVKIIRQMAPMMHEDPKTLTLRRLIDLAEESFAGRLTAQREELVILQDQLRKNNRQNAVLIKQSMKYVDKTLLILMGGSSNGSRYVRTGKADTSKSNLKGVVNQVA